MLILNPEIISEESPNESKDGSNPKEWPKETVCLVGHSILNGVDQKLLSRKKIVKVSLFSGAMISDMYYLFRAMIRDMYDIFRRND